LAVAITAAVVVGLGLAFLTVAWIHQNPDPPNWGDYDKWGGGDGR
jgi:hypothetical protein